MPDRRNVTSQSFSFQETELLMEQLVKDQEAVDQVKQIVEKEEAIMKQETDIVENYAKVGTFRI